MRSVGDRVVGSVALGSCPFGFGGADLDEASITTIRAGIEAGMTLLDTALAYTSLEEPSHAERVIAEAVRRTGRDDVVIATKGGHYRSGPAEFPKDGRPEALREHCDTSLRTLGVDTIDVYQLHWPDPAVDFLDSVGALDELRQEGKVRAVGLSNVTVEQLDAARALTPVVSVQNAFSPFHTSDLAMVRHCEAGGIAYLAYSPLGGGMQARGLGEKLPAFGDVARERGVSPQRVALAWHLALSPAIIPICGASRQESVLDSAAASGLELDADELARLDADAGIGVGVG